MVQVSDFDIEDFSVLRAYFRHRLNMASDATIQARPLSGGVSNRTVHVTLPSGERWVVKQALPKLRVHVDWFSDPGRIHREALALRWLASLLPTGSTPAFVFEDMEHHLLAMEAVPEPHTNWKAMLLEGRVDSGHVDQFARLLATLHRGGFERRDEIEPLFADKVFFRSLRLEPYYGFSASQVPRARDFLERLMPETEQTNITLTHGDFSPKNVLVRNDRLVLLDHEVMHFGDPAFDVGFSLTHLISKAHHLQEHRARFAQAAVRYWETYRSELGPVPWLIGYETRAIRHTLACLLARVAGRSPLEYLSTDEQIHQQEAVLRLLDGPPETLPQLVTAFLHLV